MEPTVSYLLMLQKYISSKQKTMYFKQIVKNYELCYGSISKDITINHMKKQD